MNRLFSFARLHYMLELFSVIACNHCAVYDRGIHVEVVFILIAKIRCESS